jgi:hypothetical protein
MDNIIDMVSNYLDITLKTLAIFGRRASIRTRLPTSFMHPLSLSSCQGNLDNSNQQKIASHSFVNMRQEDHNASWLRHKMNDPSGCLTSEVSCEKLFSYRNEFKNGKHKSRRTFLDGTLT